MKVEREKRTIGPSLDEIMPSAVNNSNHPDDCRKDLEKVMFPDFQVTVIRITTD